MPLIHEIHLGHLAGLDGVDDIDVGLHGVVGGVARPLHDDRRGNAAREGVDDEGAAAGMGADELILLLYFIYALIATVGGDTFFLVDSGNTAQNLDIPVHGLIGVIRENQAILGRDIFVFIQD